MPSRGITLNCYGWSGDMPQNTAKTAENVKSSTPEPAYIGTASLAGFLTKWNAEIVRFYSHRYQRYWTLPLQFFSCRSMKDVETLQLDFRRELIEDYQAEAARLSRIADEAPDQTLNLDEAYAAGLLKAQEDAAAIIEQAKVQAEQILASAHDQAGMTEETPNTKPARKRA